MILPEYLSKNMILYGPPGTGKTYNTFSLALNIIHKDMNYSNGLSRDEIISEYFDLKEKGRIEMVTFHQAYSYEDFVEGIKPSFDEEGEMRFSLKNGIFQACCENAICETVDQDLLDAILRDIPKGIVKSFIKFTNREQRREIYKNAPNFVIIIDEFNRGNVSKIYGELITLVESDKRLGTENEIIIKLPYSKKEFGVPDNVYIIGTMNTADRSIALLDAAIRRRFTFIPMLPEYNLFLDEEDGNEINTETGIIKVDPLGELLFYINKMIGIFLDTDHQVCHSYFLKVKFGGSTMRNVWYYEVIPLIKEYFYNDFEKLKLILGDFIEIKVFEVDETGIKQDPDGDTKVGSIKYFNDEESEIKLLELLNTYKKILKDA